MWEIRLYQRFIRRHLVEALTDTPVVLLVGPRRAGKTTLARSMSNGGRVYLTLDDQTTLEAGGQIGDGPISARC
jgi:hypothetical protein